MISPEDVPAALSFSAEVRLFLLAANVRAELFPTMTASLTPSKACAPIEVRLPAADRSAYFRLVHPLKELSPIAVIPLPITRVFIFSFGQGAGWSAGKAAAEKTPKEKV